MDGVSASNLLGYVTAFVIIVAFFAVIRFLCRCPSVPEAPVTPQPQITSPQISQVPVAPQLLEIVAAAVAGAHQYLKNKARKTVSTAGIPAFQKQFFINYWILSERLNPSYRDDPFHREKTI